MARIDQLKLQELIVYLGIIYVFTIDRLAEVLNCSVPTARLKLKQWGAHTSYNKNGRYYAMPKTPRFDGNGLWRYEDIFFSKYGSLKKTVIGLVGKSETGLTGAQIGEIVGLSPRSFLHHFRDTPGIFREKHGGVYVYFSGSEVIYHSQKRRLLEAEAEKSLSNADAITILTALIKHHNFSSAFIAALPEVKRKKISRAAIDRFMEKHGFLKKTTD
ncbi:MAG: hypothetical protein GY850_12450 [bacterium]|nr:hypothetical protein [bacterium]